MSEQTLRPVTIKQIRTAEAPAGEGICKIDKADCTQVNKKQGFVINILIYLAGYLCWYYSQYT